jgi:hypothetical protein
MGWRGNTDAFASATRMLLSWSSQESCNKKKRSEFDRARLKKEETPMQSIPNKSIIPLFRAAICLDCNCVTDANRVCPACSSRALMNLSSVLNRRNMCRYSVKDMAA